MAPDFFDRTLLQWSGYTILLAGFLLTLLFQSMFYFRLLFRMKNPQVNRFRPISVLMNIRNEEERIEKLLLQLLQQDYPEFEVVVVDDFSEDATLTIIGVMAKKYPRLKFSSLRQETHFSEKMAMNLALKAATYDWVVFVSPETEGVDAQFLQRLSEQASDSADISLNYLNYLPRPGFYNRLCRVERFYAFLSSAAYSRAGLPLFYQQSNVLFNKQLYFEVDGFRGKMNAHFAHLELVFNHLVHKKVETSATSHARLSENAWLGKPEFTDLVRKRILLWRDLGLFRRLLLLMDGLSGVLLVAGFCWLLVTEIQNWIVFTLPVLFVWLIHLFMVKTLLNRLNERKIFLSSLMYVFVSPVVSLYHWAKIYIHLQRNKWN
ncbi:MAG: glycosyltransferase [Mangrovibacterium sp.]